MKRLGPILTALCLAAMTFSACGSDTDMLPECEVSGFVTCITDADGHVTEIVDDMGHRFRVCDNRYSFESGDSYRRRICTYIIHKDSTADIKGLYVPNCMNALDTCNIEQVFRVFDPFEVESAYVGGGYLNIVLKIMTRSESAYRQHYLVPVRFESADSPVFSFIHESGGDVPVYTKKNYYCIPLADCGIQKNDTVFFKYRNYNEEDCCLKYIYR